MGIAGMDKKGKGGTIKKKILMKEIIKIVAIGPESTGKSTLCQQLATHYQSIWCPEYAREYLEKNVAGYTYDDLLTISRGQIELEESATSGLLFKKEAHLPGQGSKPLFVDTDMYVMKVWCEYAFEKCHSWILNQIATRNYDLFLLCNVDLPWIQDNLREYPDKKTRIKLYNYYKDSMINQSVPWVEISGGFQQRIGKAIQAVDNLMQ